MSFSSHAIRAQVEAALEARFPSALSFVPRPQPELVQTSIAAVDAACGGLPRGGLAEVCGPESSGRTTLLLSLLAQMTGRQEACALIDAGDNFDPQSAAAARVDLSRLLWVRCSQSKLAQKKGEPGAHDSHSGKRSLSGYVNPILSRQKQAEQGWGNHSETGESRRKKDQLSALEQALKAADQILQGGGFGLVVMDLAGVDAQSAHRVPLASWFRFRRAVENTPTIFLVVEKEPSAKTCASLVLQLRLRKGLWSSETQVSSKEERTWGTRESHPSPTFHSGSGWCTQPDVFSGMDVEVEVGRKPTSSFPSPEPIRDKKRPHPASSLLSQSGPEWGANSSLQEKNAAGRTNPSFLAKTEWTV